jgi:predicted CopG family antitoxin
MATSRPRITITLTDATYSTLTELASLQERSISAIILELLELVDPLNRKVIKTIKRLQNVQRSSNADLVKSLDKAQAQAEAALVPLMALLDSFAATKQPPSCNTGVRSGHAPISPPEKTKKNHPTTPTQPPLSVGV